MNMKEFMIAASAAVMVKLLTDRKELKERSQENIRKVLAQDRRMKAKAHWVHMIINAKTWAEYNGELDPAYVYHNWLLRGDLRDEVIRAIRGRDAERMKALLAYKFKEQCYEIHIDRPWRGGKVYPKGDGTFTSIDETKLPF